MAAAPTCRAMITALVAHWGDVFLSDWEYDFIENMQKKMILMEEAVDKRELGDDVLFTPAMQAKIKQIYFERLAEGELDE